MSFNSPDVTHSFQLCLYPPGSSSLRSLSEARHQFMHVSEVDLVHVARVANAVEMMISNSLSVVSLHETADNIAVIKKNIDSLRGFLQRRTELKSSMVERGFNVCADLMCLSENNFRLAARSIITRINSMSRLHKVNLITEARLLSEHQTSELANFRINCDNTFAEIVDLSRASFQTIVKGSTDEMDSTINQQVSDIAGLKLECLQKQHEVLDRDLQSQSHRLIEIATAIITQWESEDTNREDLQGKLAQLKSAILHTRRQKEYKQRVLIRKRQGDLKHKTDLLHDIVQIQNRYMRLEDKCQTFDEVSEGHYSRILASNRDELVGMIRQLWTSYETLAGKLSFVEIDQELKTMYEKVTTTTPDVHDDDPFGDLRHLSEQVTRVILHVRSELSQKLQKLRHRKKIP